jgi:ABC-type multidrug transport system ATPase subunit
MKLIGIVLLTFGFTQCGSLNLDTNPPFQITSAIYQNWVGGLPGTNGVLLTISYESDAEVPFDSIYFLKKGSKLEFNEYKGIKTISGRIDTSVSPDRKDFTLHVDSKKEFNNQLPTLKKFPFELKDNEAVVRYKVKGIIKYYKVKNIKKGKPIFYQ